MKGMEYKDRSGDPDLLETLIADPEWVFQQKMDGTRAMVNLETLQFSQRNGSPLKHTAATQWIPKILQDLTDIGLAGQANTILDCELMIDSGRLYVFDVIDPWYLSRSLTYRLVEMEQLPVGRYVRTVRTARTEATKRPLVEMCESAEGVVAKRVDAPYEPGKRVDHVLKLKNIHTADLVVMEVGTSPLSARMGVSTEQGLRTVTSASMIGKDQTIAVGDVVEVAYLYWTGTGLIQPRIMRRRDDKATSECTADQFTAYSREAV